jgi:hypothetical protein
MNDLERKSPTRSHRRLFISARGNLPQIVESPDSMERRELPR